MIAFIKLSKQDREHIVQGFIFYRKIDHPIRQLKRTGKVPRQDRFTESFGCIKFKRLTGHQRVLNGISFRFAI
ncbi:MAG: hypothetical protein HYX49_01370 [Chloroflexi bacterium]|nr:hypothetical protein [Chloroflexota bacterium]